MNWKLLYQDTFDRETPITIEKEGEDLKEGLFCLWQYTLSEGITKLGIPSFSRFILSTGDLDLIIDLEGTHKEQLSKFREFVYGEDNIIKDKDIFQENGKEMLEDIVDFQLDLTKEGKSVKESIEEVFVLLDNCFLKEELSEEIGD